MFTIDPKSGGTACFKMPPPNFTFILELLYSNFGKFGLI